MPDNIKVAEVQFTVYGYKQIGEMVALTAFLLDAFRAIPQAQLMYVIDIARKSAPQTCDNLDAWLDTLDGLADQARAMEELGAPWKP